MSLECAKMKCNFLIHITWLVLFNWSSSPLKGHHNGAWGKQISVAPFPKISGAWLHSDKFPCSKNLIKFLTSEGKLLEKRHKNHSVATRETSNSNASKWAAILHFSNVKKILTSNKRSTGPLFVFFSLVIREVTMQMIIIAHDSGKTAMYMMKHRVYLGKNVWQAPAVD